MPPTRVCSALALFAAAGFPALAQPVNIVNIIPSANSSETAHQSEPSLAVDPSNPSLIFATTFNNPNGGNAPVFRSTLGGGVGSWSIVQSLASSDWTINFSRTGGTCYMARLAGAGISVDQSIGGGLFNPIAAGSFSGSADQPYISTGRVGGQDRIFVSFNDLGHTPQTASVHNSLNGGVTWSGASPFRLETGTPTGISQDSPPTRTCFSNSGRAYAAWIRPSALVGASPNDLTGSLIVRRDDANAVPTFSNLGPGGNGTSPPGLTNVRMPWLLTQCGIGSGTQAQRARSSLSIAVDPNNQDRVAVAYPDAVNGTLHLHVALSTDGGNNWSEPLSPITGGAIPNLSFANNGAIGLLYQQWDGVTQSTHILQTANNFATTTDVTMAAWPGATITNPHPYLGDYYDLESVNNQFFGIFTASNDPSLAAWGNPGINVQYDRLFAGVLGQPGAQLRNAAGGAVGVSLDPFFFNVAAVPGPGALSFLLLAGIGAVRRRR